MCSSAFHTQFAMFYILLSVLFFPEIITSEHQKTFVVTAVFSQKSSHIEDFLQTVEDEIWQDGLPDGTAIHVRPHLWENISTSFLSLLDSVSGNISMVIVMEDMGRFSQTIPWLCSMFGIPVSLTYYEALDAKRKVFFHAVIQCVHLSTGIFRRSVEL